MKVISWQSYILLYCLETKSLGRGILRRIFLSKLSPKQDLLYNSTIAGTLGYTKGFCINNQQQSCLYSLFRDGNK